MGLCNEKIDAEILVYLFFCPSSLGWFKNGFILSYLQLGVLILLRITIKMIKAIETWVSVIEKSLLSEPRAIFDCCFNIVVVVIKPCCSSVLAACHP